MKYLLLACAFIHQVVSIDTIQDKPNKIVGGEEAEKGRYEYQVALINSGFQYCGGTLVDKYWVLSAAHCYGNKDRVYIGRHDLTDNTKEFESIKVEQEIKHPGYNSGTLENDIMMIKLKNPSEYNPVKLDDGSIDLPSGTDVTVMGWGTTSFGGYSSNVLMEVEVDVVKNSQCNIDYGGGITDDMMCASRSGKDSCQGDSGGPLIIKGMDASEDVQVGVVSWGNGCADANYPGVYARVGKQIDWIKEQINSGTDGPPAANDDGEEEEESDDNNNSEDDSTDDFWSFDDNGEDGEGSVNDWWYYDDEEGSNIFGDDWWGEGGGSMDDQGWWNNDISEGGDDFGEGSGTATEEKVSTILSQILELISALLEQALIYVEGSNRNTGGGLR